MPVLLRLTSSQNTFVGEELIVECELEGIPHPTVEWMKDGDQLIVSRRESIIPPGTNRTISRVIIDSATTADAGVYICIGINAAGSVSGTIQVEINECENMITL